MNSEGGNYVVDLTLKLGLPNEDNKQTINRQQVHCNPTTSDVTNFCGPYTNHQDAPNSYGMVSGGGQANMNVNGMVNRENAAVINYGMVNHGGNIQNDGQNFNLNESQIAWLQQNCMNSSNYQYGGGSVVGIPISSSNYFNAPVPTLNNYTLLDNSTRRIDIEDIRGSSSINSRRNDSRRQRVGNYCDPTKRCSNYNCNTNDTPMWRKGPLGPKTLCNACGIKYRKEVEKRRAKEAATTSTSKSNG